MERKSLLTTDEFGPVTIVSTDWLESVIARLHTSGIPAKVTANVRQFQPVQANGPVRTAPSTKRRGFVKGGAYSVKANQNEVRGGETVQQVFQFLKANPGIKSMDIINGLKMPASSVYNALRQLQSRGAIVKGAVQQVPQF